MTELTKTRVNYSARKFEDFWGNWADTYVHIMNAFHELGHPQLMSKYINMDPAKKPDFVDVDITHDNKDEIYVYNHWCNEFVFTERYNLGSMTLHVKPTAPTNRHFSLDLEGYASSASIVRRKPKYEDKDPTSFFEVDVPKYIAERTTKWTGRSDFDFDAPKPYIPDDAVLVIGQVPTDETVTKFSFGGHWEKTVAIVEYLKKYYKKSLVVKLHPTIRGERLKGKQQERDLWRDVYRHQIADWRDEGIIVLTGFESLYDILPKTKVAILENSTAGIECLMHRVPVISYGLPDYHWATLDLRHLHTLRYSVWNPSAWHNPELADKFIAWYCQDYLCYDYESTLRRIKLVTGVS